MRAIVRRFVLLASTLVLSVDAPAAVADDGMGILLVTASPSGTCEIDDSIRGPSPLVARLASGEHAVTCRSQIDGVSVKRSAKAVVQAGKGTRIAIEMKVAQ